MERLAREGRVVTTRRVVAWLINHDYDSAALLVEVLSSLRAYGRWLGSSFLANSAVADEYRVVVESVEWYVKFYLDGARAVVVWSCWWEGTAH